MSIGFDCASCGKHFEVKEELAGRKAKCSRCAAILVIPPPVLVHVADHPAEDEYRLATVFDDELEGAGQTANNCPNCSAALSPEAVLCVHCGFHLKKGKRIDGPQEKVPAMKAPAAASNTKLQRPRGAKNRPSQFNFATYLRGTFFSLLGALLGGGLWTAIALTTGYSLGFLAWVIGGLAGLGMALGYQNDGSVLAGMTAAGMTLVGCVFGKVLWFALYLGAIGSTIDEVDHHYVASIVAEESFRLQGIAPDEVEEDRLDAEIEKTIPRVASWSDQQIAERIALYEDANRSEAYQILFGRELTAIGKRSSDLQQQEALRIYQKLASQVVEMSDQEVVNLLAEESAPPEAAVAARAAAPAEDQQGSSIFSVVLVAMLAFGIFGGVFLVLGMLTAYRVGSGQMTA